MTSTDSNFQFVLVDPSQKQISGEELSFVRSHASRFVHAQKHADNARHASTRVARYQELRERRSKPRISPASLDATGITSQAIYKGLDSLNRPPAMYSTWYSGDHQGLQIFLHDIMGEINPTFNNMHFWRSFVPCLASQISAVRKLVGTIGHFGLLMKDRHNQGLAEVLATERQAIYLLTQDLTTLPLIVQVVCCVLLEALCVLKCDFPKADAHNNIAGRLLKQGKSSTIALETFDEMLVRKVVGERSTTTAWGELWNYEMQLKYEQVRCRGDYIEVTLQCCPRSLSCLETILSWQKDLSFNVLRLRRNLSTAACIDPSSRLAQGILLEFYHLTDMLRQQDEVEESMTRRLLRRRIEIAAHASLVQFATGVISYQSNPYKSQTARFQQILTVVNHHIRDHERYLEHYISPELAHPSCSVFPALWLTAIWCQDRTTRCTAIRLLRNQYLQNPVHSRVFLSHLAELLMGLEDREGQLVQVHDLQVIMADEDATNTLSLVYTLVPYTTAALDDCSDPREECFAWPKSPGDGEQSIRRAVLFVLWFTALYRKADIRQAPRGFVWPMVYEGRAVVVMKDG